MADRISVTIRPLDLDVFTATEVLIDLDKCATDEGTESIEVVDPGITTSYRVTRADFDRIRQKLATPVHSSIIKSERVEPRGEIGLPHRRDCGCSTCATLRARGTL